MNNNEQLKRTIEKFVASIPPQTKANVDAKVKFDKETVDFINAFVDFDLEGYLRKCGVAIRTENGEYRNTCDILSDLSKAYKNN